MLLDVAPGSVGDFYFTTVPLLTWLILRGKKNVTLNGIVSVIILRDFTGVVLNLLFKSFFLN